MSYIQHKGNLCQTELSGGIYVDFKQHENIFWKGYLLLFLEGCPLLNIQKVSLLGLNSQYPNYPTNKTFWGFLENI